MTASSRCSRRMESGDELVGLLLLALGGVAVIAVRRARGARDEAERRQIADERLRALIAESPVVSYSWDPTERRYLFISPQIETLFGVTADEHAADWSGQIHPDDLERVRAISAQADRERDHLPRRVPHHACGRRGAMDPRRVPLPPTGRRRAPDARPGRDVRHHGTHRSRGARVRRRRRFRTLVERVPAIAYSWDTAFAQGTAPADYISPQIEAARRRERTGLAATTRPPGRTVSTRTISTASSLPGMPPPTPASRSPRSTGCARPAATGCGCATTPTRSDRDRTARRCTRGSSSTSPRSERRPTRFEPRSGGGVCCSSTCRSSRIRSRSTRRATPSIAGSRGASTGSSASRRWSGWPTPTPGID